MPRHCAHRCNSVFGLQCFDDRQVLVGLVGQSSEIVPSFVLGPRYIAERPKQRLQPVQLTRQKPIAARIGDQVVQATVNSTGFFDKPLSAHEFFFCKSL